MILREDIELEIGIFSLRAYDIIAYSLGINQSYISIISNKNGVLIAQDIYASTQSITWGPFSVVELANIGIKNFQILENDCFLSDDEILEQYPEFLI